MDSLYSIAFIVSAAISLFVAVSAWKKRAAPGALGLALLCFGQFEWSAMYALPWILTDHGPSTFWFLARFIGLQLTPTAILIMVLGFTGRTRWLRPKIFALLAIEPVVAFAIAATEPMHGLYLGGMEPALKIVSGGPAWWFNIAYSYLIILLSAAFLVSRLFRQRVFRLQTSVVLIAVMLPVVHFLVQLAGIDLLPKVNSVPFTFTITGIMEWFALTRLGLFRVIPIARDQLIEQMSEGIIVFDSNRLIADINPAAARMTGVSASCIGKSADEAFPRFASTTTTLRAALLTGGPASVRSRFGTNGVMEATASEVAGPEGGRVATLVTLRDVTAETLSEAELEARSKELAAALERSRSILAAMSEGVLLVDESSHILQANSASSDILGIEPARLHGASVADVMPSLMAKELTVAATSDRTPVITQQTLPDGRSLIVEVIPLLESSSTAAASTVFVIRDETARLATERMQRDFIANAAHELQTPLTGLSLLAETIPRALRNDPESAAGFIDRLGMEVGRLTRMTSELMSLSRVDHADSNRSKKIDLSTMLSAEVAQIDPSASARAQTLVVDIAEGIFVFCDDLDIRVIAGNLMENAIHYTEPGGEIVVSLCAEKCESSPVCAVLSVKDNGTGIPAADLERIFERFYRVDKARSRRTGGAGLGLSIVRGAVERCGGSISVESVLGEGSTFTVRIPAVD